VAIPFVIAILKQSAVEDKMMIGRSEAWNIGGVDLGSLEVWNIG
jgi:hypothetical protein